MARVEWRLVDIARTFYSFCGNDVQASINKMKIFIGGYQSRARLTENEFRFFPQVWEYLNIKGYILAWQNYSNKTKRSNLKKAKRSFERRDWMKANQNLVLEGILEKCGH